MFCFRNVRAEARTLQHIFITLGGPQAHEHFGRDDKASALLTVACDSSLVAGGQSFGLQGYQLG
jgi:hypothetical protein